MTASQAADSAKSAAIVASQAASQASDAAKAKATAASSFADDAVKAAGQAGSSADGAVSVATKILMIQTSKPIRMLLRLQPISPRVLQLTLRVLHKPAMMPKRLLPLQQLRAQQLLPAPLLPKQAMQPRQKMSQHQTMLLMLLNLQV